MDPCTIVLFGATGDLAEKKLIPALYRLHVTKHLHPKTRIVAVGRRAFTAASIAHEYAKSVPKDVYLQNRWKEFTRRLSYHRLEFHDKGAYDALAARLSREPRRLFYLATPQKAFPLIMQHLRSSGAACRLPRKGWHRLVFEKPFGSDLKSARALNKAIGTLFDEKQVYRIDHYLGKSFVQEIFAIRFANPVFEHLWNKEYIDNVQLVVSEKAGVGSRGEYYDNAGAIRDMVQNHLLQLVSLVAMEPPLDSSSDALRKEKEALLAAIRPGGVVRGQYASYRSEPDVRDGSNTETYVALELAIANRRWQGVPFYLRTGKELKHHYAQVAITFKQGPCLLFQNKCPETNVLVIRIQPDEGIKLRVNLAEGEEASVEPQEMSFLHRARGFNTPEAYELLLSECIDGDQSLFTSWGFVERSWKITDAVRAKNTPLHPYPTGSHGPHAALELLKKDGRDWIGNSEIITSTERMRK